MELKKNPSVSLANWSSTFFLMGLAMMLFISYQAIESKSFDRDLASGEVLDVGDDLEDVIPITDQLTPPPPPPPPPPAISTQVIEVVENDSEVDETLIESSETDQDQVIVEIEEIEDVDVEEEEIVYVPFAVIEDVPIYPGCESKTNNNDRKQCMEAKVMEFVQNKFNTELANDLGLEGKQRISVQFKIDKEGNVVNVRARAPHPRLEQEAIRLVESLPKMIPGKQRGKPVGVLYALPILFKVENTN
ncbi:energy transducer TonB [Aureisphaera sp. CAU 1614]|uniref:Energy transducer TonB n=1 Tax=Halomarinibacterium sedimenti TaxID=2857106 RepID=A0A9X1FMW4_9FLAO|nr:energy transducer TonB [Halomarinibacterium sedimenti]MBW2937419.1 energy transducer TonB [Halomarinibacterium sedimenti]